MSADRRLVFEITGDATGWALAVRDAQTLNGQAVANATTLNSNLKRLDDERAASYISTLKAMGSAFVAFMAISEVSKMLDSAQHAFANYGHALTETALIMNTTVQNAAALRFEFQSVGLDADATAKMVTTLTRNMEHNTAEFEALGVQTHDASGHLRNAYDVIRDLQSVVSSTAGDNDKLATTMLTVARAAGVGSGSIAALESWLSMTAAEVDANRKLAESLGLVWDQQTAVAANNLWHEMQTLKSAQEAAALSLSTSLAPATEWATHAFLVGIEVVKEYGRILLEVASIGVRFFLLDFKGAVDTAHQALDDFANAGTWDQIIAKVDRQIALGKLASASGGGTGILPGPVTGSGGASTAIQDQQAELRAALEAYLAEKQAAIDAINEVKAARDQAFNDHIDQLSQLEEASKAGHQAEIDRINDETRALDDQYALRQRGRDDAIAGLRAQIALLDQQFSIETAQDQLAKDQRALTVTQSEGPVTMRRGEHLEDYYKRVHEHEIKLADETKKIGDDKEKIALDAQKRILDDQIKAIEAVGKAGARALEDEKKAASARIRDIEEVQKAEAARTAATIKGIRDQMKETDEASKAEIKGIQAEMKTEKERVDDQILQLGKLLKAHQGFTGGVIKDLRDQQAAADEAAAAVQRLNDVIINVHNTARNPDVVTANQGTTTTPDTTPKDPRLYGGPGGTISPRPAPTPPFSFLGDIWRSLTETHAGGGSIYLSQPAAIVGLGTRTVLGVAGAGETATITPRGGSRGGLVVQVVLPNGHVLAEAVMPHVTAQLAREDDMANASGAVRRS